MKKVLFTFLLLFLVCPFFVFATGTVDINTATLSQLDELTGIGPVYAQRIIDNRPYSLIDDLDKVKGIGIATLQKIKDQGIACVNCQTEISQTQNTEAANQNLTDTTSPATAPATIPQTTYPSGVFINEILPNPKGADETDEWIEIYNSNTFEVDLSGWQIQDTIGTPKTYTINPSASSGQAKILANGFLIFKRPDTNIMLNNDGDGLNLLTPDKKVKDSVNFTKAPLGQSYNKTSGGWSWSTTLTPETKNIITAIVAKSTSKTLPNAKNSVKNDGVEVGLADLSQSINQDGNNTNPWFLFFMVLAVTIILATIVLLIKIRFKGVTKI